MDSTTSTHTSNPTIAATWFRSTAPTATPITAANRACNPIWRISSGIVWSSGTLRPFVANQARATRTGTDAPTSPNSAPTGAAASILEVTTRARRGAARYVMPTVP